ncbi:hypothetical protein [Verrucomicrobium spinosum]|uniref:hypothetical protein n=1 Tax=Verrucomicrobium spinosum TaxID=2736 RepID=UPI00155DC8FF|nr:hypothetical protein [Verrucomicrobium spinosum]
MAPISGGAPVTVSAQATVDQDLCLHWQVKGLRPGTAYRYRVLSNSAPVANAPEQSFKTLPNLTNRARCALPSVPAPRKTRAAGPSGIEWRRRRWMP